VSALSPRAAKVSAAGEPWGPQIGASPGVGRSGARVAPGADRARGELDCEELPEDRPIAAPPYREYLAALQCALASGEPVAIATVVAVEGSASARPGAKAILGAGGERRFGWVGGGCAESAVRDAALAAFEDGAPRLLRLDLDDEVLGVGMPCGGFMTVYVEPVLAEPRLLILGHGVIAETLAEFAAALGFAVHVNDPLASAERFPRAQQCVADDPEYAKLECSGETYAVITTQHKSDFEALSAVLRGRPAYVGLVASRKRSALLLARLHEEGFSPEQLRGVRAPAGLDVGSATPQEIALSIAAELVRERRGAQASGRPLVELKGPRIGAQGVEVPSGPLGADRCPS
jgi:xanthine dehydrogenase accessory factor